MIGDGVADEGGAFLGEQFDEPLLLGDKLVNSSRLLVQKRRNRPLFGKRRCGYTNCAKVVLAQVGLATSC